MFRYERVNVTRKFTIVVEIVSSLKKIYKRDAPFRAVFKERTLAVLLPPYTREMKTNNPKFNLPPFCRLLFCMEMQTHSHARSIARAWLKHAHSFDRCETIGSITSRCSRKEPALLPRTHGWTREDSFVSLNQSDIRPQIFVGHKLSHQF